ncbi:metal ABC transporter solute-binding protein, Zn/Mn family [Bifidobacterium miconisargentati]|uniref:metal ABC transporter solute-binding protein, Zn/Mn family n=1 Tax=Bifidobacterium miconisargentati TaxID=2834437 RepID=UPI001BDBF80E|nr:ZinT/AdcA family metal-binding protein [Bifidobacterium miconisargentati]MBW3089989.1 ZinT/AdcA family metal-binding protein [Bifidobacterium miconisargentati]
MTDPNTSQPSTNHSKNHQTDSPIGGSASDSTARSSNASAVTTTVSKRNTIIGIVVAFVIGAVLGVLILGAFTFLKPNGSTSSTVGNTTSPAADATNDSCDTTFTVVASVNQWGSLAQQLGGSCATVTSLINSTSADPHDYEATASDLAKLAKADIVVLNGAGYDGWAEKAQLDTKRQAVVNVGDLMGITATEEHEHDHDHADGEEGHHHHHGSTNPHLWFSPEAVLKAAEAINAAYTDKAGASSATAATAQRHFNEWNGEYADFVTLVNKARSTDVQRRYVATESIISYLLEYIGAIDKTPATYTNAMNSEAEPSAADLKNAMGIVSGNDVDLLVVNPQEMNGFAKKLNEAAQSSNKTIISVTEQLPENQKTLLGWLTLIANQALATDTTNGYFLTQDVKDRSLSDYEGEWQSVYPLLQDGTLDKVMEAKAKKGDMTAAEYTKYYDAGYKTDVERIAIKGDQMSFTRGGKTATATYEYSGFKILDYAKGNRGVRYLFTATGDAPEGAPKIVQFSDHGIAPTKAAHFHIFMGNDSQEETLKEMDNWPTYYPASMSKEEVATEMLAH